MTDFGKATPKSHDEADAKQLLEDFHYFRNEIYKYPDGGEPLLKVYNDWAGKFMKKDLDVGYVGPTNLAIIASDFLSDKSARILDAASGTGLVGKELNELGFSCVDAFDPCQWSLDHSKTRQVYREYICDTLDGHKTKIQNDCYDAVLMCGAFGLPGHVTETSFPELIRITKPGGHIMFTINMKVLDSVQIPMDAAIKELRDQGMWEVVDTRWTPYLTKDGEDAKVVILQIIEKSCGNHTSGPKI